MIKVTALGKVSQMNFSFYQNISKKEGINIQWSIPTLLPTPYIRHHKKEKRHCTSTAWLTSNSPTPPWRALTDWNGRTRLMFGYIWPPSACSGAGVVRQKGGEAQKSIRKSNRGGYRVRVANATQWTHNPLLLGEYRRKQQSHGRQALTYKML